MRNNYTARQADEFARESRRRMWAVKQQQARSDAEREAEERF